MKADGCVHKSSVSPSWAKGTCPFRRVPKECQSASADQIQIAADVRLCNFHTWLLARGAPAKQVAAFYLKMLDGPPVVGASSSWKCDFCRRIIQEENVRLRELVQQMPRALFLDWMRSQMSLCLDHPHKLWRVEPSGSELKRELGAFLEQVVRENHIGGGILGRAAESLGGQ